MMEPGKIRTGTDVERLYKHSWKTMLLLLKIQRQDQDNVTGEAEAEGSLAQLEGLCPWTAWCFCVAVKSQS